MESLAHDYLVILTASVFQGHILELYWCAYEVSTRKVAEESSVCVKPPLDFPLAVASEALGLEQSEIDEGDDWPSALQKFNMFVYENIILKNSTLCLVTLGDELLGRDIPELCAKTGVKLAPHFSKCFVLETEFAHAYPEAKQNLTLAVMLQHTRLKDKPCKPRALYECRTTVRLVNRMLKDGYQFTSPKDVTPFRQPLLKAAPDPILPEPPTLSRVIRLRGLPMIFSDGEVEEFLFGIRLDKLLSVLDPYKQPTGEFVVRCMTVEDAFEALSFNHRRLSNRMIDVVESSEAEFSIVQSSNEAALTPPLAFYKVADATSGYLYTGANDKFYVCSEGSAPPPNAIFVDEQEFFRLLRPLQSTHSRTLTSEEKSRSVRIRGFSVVAKKEEILEYYLRDFNLTASDLVLAPDGRQGEVLVTLQTPDEKERLMRTLAGVPYAGRFIEIFPLN
mmetsp:Transcript_10649/g.20638  ORF Transcript_10649/g.20638 Transcript_10649/m.20638 type:complete len:448 (+) Transcript_10649:120-1463(+)